MRRAVLGVVTVLLLLSLRLGTPGEGIVSSRSKDPQTDESTVSQPSEMPVIVFGTEHLIPDKPVQPTPIPTPVLTPVLTAEPTEPVAVDPNLLQQPVRAMTQTLMRFGMRMPDGTTLRLSPYAAGIGISEDDLKLAAKVAYFEAGPGASEQAHRAVLCVLYNRCVTNRFGGTMTDIPTEVYRAGQFSVIGHRLFETLDPPEQIVGYARDIFVFGNTDLPQSVLFFHAARLGANWGGRKVYGNIGGNLFFYGRTE